MCNKIICFAVLLVGVGCASTTIRKNPGPHDHGFRFYRPKPYLMITPVPASESKDAPEYVKIEWQMLPDFSEQYSIHARAGFGVNNTKVTLDNGWNLTQIDFDIDQKTDDNIKAVGSLIKSVGGTFGPSAANSPIGKKHLVTAHMPARNVPLGLYEAVIDFDPARVKRLYGWRYVGFVPFKPCPISGSGTQCEECGLGRIYGLVHEGGVMVFKRLEDMDQQQVELVTVLPSGPKTTAELQAVIDDVNVAKALLAAANSKISAGNAIISLVASAKDKATLIFEATLEKKEPDEAFTSNRLKIELQRTVRLQKGMAGVNVSNVTLMSKQ